ncbi:MAG: pyruvate formate lyase family protein, partial [Desulfobulbaceae bacterium]|nr:pyruvate formate lyase family protein [Desulfobulbaceae bacterium]
MPRQNNFDKYLEDYGITDRVSHLRDVYFQAMPEICIERPSLIAKSCIKNSLFGKERISILDKAKMYRYVLAKRKPMVRHRHGFESRGPGKKMRRFTFSDNSLFAGSTTSKFKGVPIFPEFLGLSIWPELKNISIRHKNPYQLSKKDARILNEQVFPHCMEENILEKTRSRCRDNGNDPVGINLLQHIVFFMTTKINCISHTIPDFKRVVGEGLDEIIREAIEKRKNTDNAAKREFYSAVIEAMKGIIAYSTNLAKEAERLALKEDNPVKKQELLDIAEIHRHIPRHPARTFREGLTAIWICWTAMHLENPNVGLSLGRLDQVLYDLYAKDINNTLSMEDALELICCFWLKIGDHVPMIPDAGEQLFGGTGSNQAITIGGVQPNDSETAQDAVNELTYVMLRATELMMLRDPNLNARYHEGAHDNDYLKRLCDSNLKTKATPALHNDKAVIKALMSQGETLAQARDYSAVGCVEPVSSGRAYTASSSIMLNLTSI